MRWLAGLLCVSVVLVDTVSFAADRAIEDCGQDANPDRQISGCSQLLARRRLPPKVQAMAFGNRGLAHQRKGELDDAIADFSQGTRSDPAFAKNFYDRGAAYDFKNDPRALDDYAEALRLQPRYSAAYDGRGVHWAKAGDTARAIEDFTRAIQADARNLEAYVHRATALSSTGNTAAAVADLDVVLRATPGNVELTNMRARLLAAQSASRVTAPIAPADSSSNNAIPQNLDALQQRMKDLYTANKLEEALRVAEDYLPRVKEQFGDRSMRYAEALGAVGFIQRAMSHYKEAAHYDELKLALLDGRTDPNSRFVTSAKQKLGQDYLELGRFDEAERLAREVVQAAETRGGPDNSDLADALNDLSIILVDKARYSEAERASRRAYDIWSKAKGADAQRATLALTNLASILTHEGRGPEAETIYLRIADDAEKQGPRAENDLAQTLGRLAILYQQLGRYSQAEETGKRSLALVEKLGGPNDPVMAIDLVNIANTYSFEGKDHEAELALDRALRVREKTEGPDSEVLGNTLYALGTVMLREGRPAEAEPLFSRALTIAEKTLGPDHPTVGQYYLNGLAIAVASQGDLERSNQLLRRALAIEEKAHGPDSPGLAAMLNNLGAHLQTAGQLDEAAALFSRSIAVSRSAVSTQPDMLPEALEALANIRMNQNKPAEAEALYKEALAIRQKVFGRDDPKSAILLSRIGLAADRQNDRRRALDASRQGYDAAIRSNDRLGKVRQTAAGAADTLAIVSADLASVDWTASVEDVGQAHALKDEAFGAAQRWNVSLAGAALADMAARFGAGTGAIAGIVRQQQDLANQAQALDKALTQALGSPDADSRDARVDTLRSQVASVDASLSEINGRIAHDFPTYAELSDPKPLAIADVQKLLAPDEVLVTWVNYHAKTLVWAITKEGSAWQSVDLKDDDLKNMVAKLRGSLDLDTFSRGLARGDAGRDLVFDLATAHALYEKLLAPVASQLVGKTTIVEVPVGALTSLPLQVLLTDKPRRSAISMSDPAYRDAPWLAKSYAVTVLPSVSSLRALRVFTQASAAPKPLAGFADPVFSRTPADGGTRGSAVAQRGVQALSHYYRGGSVDLYALRTGLPALPETADELKAVAHDLAANTADLRIGEAATVAAVKAMPLDQYRVVYFATHGLVAGDVSGLTEPALALTIPPHPTETDSGLLKASDVGQLKLNADWVVLSACNTAAGDKPGAEGLSGLTRAFFYAGARALLVSNWSVRSDAAVDLTTHTFAKMTATPGLGRSEALRQSMLELIASGDDHAYPAVWAPFVVVGEGGRRQ